MRQVVFCCELESGVYGQFVHEADAVLISLGLELSGGRRSFAAVGEFWSKYQLRVPGTPRFEAVMAEPEKEYGWDEISTGYSRPFSEAFEHRASLLDLPNVGYFGERTRSSVPLFEVRGYPALQSLREALAEGYEVRMMDRVAEYTGEKDPEQTLRMISPSRIAAECLPATAGEPAPGRVQAFPFLVLDADAATAEERLRRRVLPELRPEPGFAGLIVLTMSDIRDGGRDCTELQVLALRERNAPDLRELLHTELADLLVKHRPPLHLEITGWSLPEQTTLDLHATAFVLPASPADPLTDPLSDELQLLPAVAGFLNLRRVDGAEPGPSSHRLVLHDRAADEILFDRALGEALRRSFPDPASRRVVRSAHRASLYRP